VPRIGIGGPVGSGKTALVAALCRALSGELMIGVVTNDIYTMEDADFLRRAGVLPDARIRAVQTGACPHTAIRDDISANLDAVEQLEADPYPIYEQLREEEPVCYVESVGLWLVTRWDDVRAVLADPVLFTSRHGNVLADKPRSPVRDLHFRVEGPVVQLKSVLRVLKNASISSMLASIMEVSSVAKRE